MSTGFVRLEANPASGMQASDMTPPDAFTTDDKTELNHPYFAARDDSILTGVWECAPSKEIIDAYPVNEMMTVLSGSVTLTSPEGRSETFVTGDTFFIPKGERYPIPLDM